MTKAQHGIPLFSTFWTCFHTYTGHNSIHLETLGKSFRLNLVVICRKDCTVSWWLLFVLLSYPTLHFRWSCLTGHKSTCCVQWNSRQTMQRELSYSFVYYLYINSGGSRGRRRRAPPYGSRFFRFDIQIFRNIAASGVGTPPYEVGAPPMGNPGSATD